MRQRATARTKRLHNRFTRWRPNGLFGHIFAKLVGEEPTPGRIMIDATHLKDHRTAASLLTKDMTCSPSYWAIKAGANSKLTQSAMVKAS